RRRGARRVLGAPGEGDARADWAPQGVARAAEGPETRRTQPPPRAAARGRRAVDLQAADRRARGARRDGQADARGETERWKMKTRAPRPSDVGFLLDGYRDSYFDSYAAGSLPADLFKAAHKEAWKRVLAKSKALILCDEEDEDTDIAFIVWQPDVDVRG